MSKPLTVSEVTSLWVSIRMLSRVMRSTSASVTGLVRGVCGVPARREGARASEIAAAAA